VYFDFLTAPNFLRELEHRIDPLPVAFHDFEMIGYFEFHSSANSSKANTASASVTAVDIVFKSAATALRSWQEM
jgi:hypothetical protein